MQTTLRKVGNSKGVIIPTSFLAEAGLEEKVELTLQNRAIVITPVQKELRAKWFEGYQAAEDEDGWADFVPLPSEEEEWEW